MRARQRGAVCNAMAVRVSFTSWRTAESAGLESGWGRDEPAPTRSVILCGERWRLSGGRVEAEPVAEPGVIARVVEVLAAGLLRAGWRTVLVDVGPSRCSVP